MHPPPGTGERVNPAVSDYVQEVDERGVDAVNVYLNEIGKIPLLSAADEKRLARKIEEGKLVEVLEQEWKAEYGRPPSGRETLFALAEQYSAAQVCVRFIAKEIGMDVPALAEVLQPTPRLAFWDDHILETLTAQLESHQQVHARDRDEWGAAIVRLSTIAHILRTESFPVGVTLLENVEKEGALESALCGYFLSLKQAGKEAREQLTRANLRLVVSVAKRYVGRSGALLDLIQEGNIGLMQAVDRFDWRRGTRFSTLATWWIRQAIARAIPDQSRMIRLPAHIVETINKLRRVSRALEQGLGREPTTEEIGAALSEPDGAAVTPERVWELMLISQATVTLDALVGDEGSNLGDILPDEAPSPEEAVMHQLRRGLVRSILEGLPDRENKVLSLRFGLESEGQRSQ
jgi:RNA polymerase primary sigma factor